MAIFLQLVVENQLCIWPVVHSHLFEHAWLVFISQFPVSHGCVCRKCKSSGW